MASTPRLSVLEEFVESKDGFRLLLRSWRPENIRAVVAILHDRGSTGGDYWRFAEAAATRDIASYAIDVRGWGRSRDYRLKHRPIDGYLRDTEAMMLRIRERHSTKPLFVLGHGTGAMVAFLHAVRHQAELDGIICEGIVLDSSWHATILRSLGRLIHSVFRLPETMRLPINGRLHASLGELSLPLLLLHGSEDRSAPPSDSEYLHARVGSGDKTLQIFEGYQHDLINDRGHAIVRGKTCQWIEAQLNSSACRRRIGIEYING